MIVQPQDRADRVPGHGRYASLDGLRGLAAVVVIVEHAMLVSPAAADAVRGDDASGWVRWMADTPLHLAWAGTEAVVVFFVLSGFVLALPFLRPQHQPWRAYYPSRLVRLYLPVAASLALAVGTYLAVDHTARPGMSWWLAGHDISPDPGAVAHDLLLLDGTGWTNSVLWSLRWEVVFSLLLPLTLVVATRARRWRPALGVAALLLIGLVGAAGIPSGAYLVMFSIGVLMAAEHDRLRALVTRVRRPEWAAVVVVTAALLLAEWWPGTTRTLADGPTPAAGAALVTVGAALLVVVFLWCPPAVALGRSRPVLWLGTRSFSLYLVHEPVVVCTALLLRTANPATVLAVALPVSLLVTAVFFRLVERPSHRAAKWVGRVAGRRAGRRDATPAAAR